MRMLIMLIDICTFPKIRKTQPETRVKQETQEILKDIPKIMWSLMMMILVYSFIIIVSENAYKYHEKQISIYYM